MTELSPWKSGDAEQLVKLLNFVAQKAKFEVSVGEIIEFYRLLNWAQMDLKPKIEKSVDDGMRVIKEGENPAKAKPSTKK